MNASLRITITKAVVDAIDANHALAALRVPVRVSTATRSAASSASTRGPTPTSAGGDFFSVGGVAYIEGHEGRWTIQAVTSADSRRPLWDDGELLHRR